MDDSINNRNNKTTRFNVARDNNLNCIIYKFIQKYGFKTYFQDNISIKSNFFQKILKFIIGNYYYKSSKKIQLEKAKDFNQNEIQEKLDENFSSKPLVKKLRGGPRINLLTNLKSIPYQTKEREVEQENKYMKMNYQK